jgi:hypothetical protein
LVIAASRRPVSLSQIRTALSDSTVANCRLSGDHRTETTALVWPVAAEEGAGAGAQSLISPSRPAVAR